ncbi:MAG: hypothetical protein KKF10_00985 [Verrucomicrobia bacterium]|nr:hypothetical protein [Verrucomicrobiota bacterium]
MKTVIGLLLSLIITRSLFAQGISVNFDGAKVVYIDENYILNKIDESGNVSSVLSTNVGVSYIHFSEQGNLFVVFQSRQRFSDGYDYLLARAVPTNNTISGIDTNLSQIAWDSSGLSPSVQSDASNNLYYLAYPTGGGLALKKCANGNGTNIVNLINDNIWINHWLVQSDGTILMGGYTQSTLAKWLRKLMPDNNLSPLAVDVNVDFMLNFPDNRVYAGLRGADSYFGVYRLPDSLSIIDAYTPYIGDQPNIYTPEYLVSSIIDGHDPSYVEGFSFGYGSHIVKYIKTDSGRIIVLAGELAYGKTIVQYYPAPPEIIEPTLINSPTLIEKISHLLLIVGTKNGFNHKLILYDPVTSNEISLLNEEIEIYHLTSLYDGYVWLDGLKFNGNRYVVGKIQITINPGFPGTVKSVGQFQEILTLSGKPADLVGIVVNPILAPTGITASDGTYSNLVRVTWAVSTHATGYQIRRCTNSVAELSSQIGTSSTTTYDDTTATPGTLYYYWGKATDGSNVSAFSSSDTGYCGSTNAVIGPVIKANGQLDNVAINNYANLSITVQIDPGQYQGVNVDWWIIALAGSSWYYLNNSMQWTPFDGNLSKCHPVYQGELFNLPATEVLNITGLGTGSYTFYFAVDYPMNEMLNLEQIWVNAVTVNVQ